MPPVEAVPRGARRDLLAELHDLYRATGGVASTREVSRWTRELTDAEEVSHALVGNLMGGRVVPRLDKVLSVARALARHAREEGTSRLDEERVRSLWRQVRHPDAHAEEQRITARVRPAATETGLHVARAVFRRGLALAGNRAEFAQGAVGIAVVAPEPEVCRRVFDAAFQDRLSQRQEIKYLRRDGHHFDTRHLWTSSSFVVHGPISGHRARSYVAVEVTVHGTVGVYFREDTRSLSLDELLTFDVHGAWAVAFDALRTLGLFGEAWGATLVDHRGVAELTSQRSTSHNRWIHDDDASVVSHGLVALIEHDHDPLGAATQERDTARRLLPGPRELGGAHGRSARRRGVR